MQVRVAGRHFLGRWVFFTSEVPVCRYGLLADMAVIFLLAFRPQFFILGFMFSLFSGYALAVHETYPPK